MRRGLVLLVVGATCLCCGCGASPGPGGTPSLVSLAVLPGGQGIRVGDRLHLMVVATYEDGTTRDLTREASWRSSEPRVVRLEQPGAARAVGNGTATVTAELGRRSSQTTVRVGRRSMGPLRVSKANPRYFVDATGRIVYLAGAHTWDDLVDQGVTAPPPTFDYGAFLDSLQMHRLRVFRMWAWETTRMAMSGHDYFFSPSPYRRTGPGRAGDGGPRFDLTKLDPTYFSRLRRRVVLARERGIYVIVMLFNGWSVSGKNLPKRIWNPWLGDPFNRLNNVNGIDGDPEGTGDGHMTQTLAEPAVTRLQERYVARVVRAVDDQPNVLYEIDNEGSPGSLGWQEHFVRFVRAREPAGRRHPVGITSEFPEGSNAELLRTNADWISPNGDLDDPTAASGKKVILADTDHLCGICGDVSFPWRALTRGLNPMLMDPWDGRFVDSEGIGVSAAEPRWAAIRQRLGATVAVAAHLDLARLTPEPSLSSTRFCLCDARHGDQYLVYLPDGGGASVDVSASRTTLRVEWVDPDTGAESAGGELEGGAVRTLSAPGDGDAVLLLTAGPRPAGPAG